MFIKNNPKFKINIVVARHGSTILNADGRYQGTRFDYSLSSKGVHEISELAKKIKQQGFTFDAIISSDTTRTQQTGEILTGISRDKFILDPRLRPLDVGSADGKRECDMFTIFRLPIFAKDKEKILTSFLTRIRSFLRDTLANFNGKTILIVTHEDVSGIMDAYLKNYPFFKGAKNGIKNGDARLYVVQNSNSSQSSNNNINHINPKDIHFHGPQNVTAQSKEISCNTSKQKTTGSDNSSL